MKGNALDRKNWIARVHENAGWDIAQEFMGDADFDEVERSFVRAATFVEVPKELIYERADLIGEVKVLLSDLESSVSNGVVPFGPDTDLAKPWPEHVVNRAFRVGQILSDKTELRRLAGYTRKKTGGRTRPDYLSQLRPYYDDLFPELTNAKDWINERWSKWIAAHVKDWKRLVRDTYPALSALDDDLLERLSPDPQLTPDDLQLLENKDHDFLAVSYIAVEAAARKCGCNPYTYQGSYLFELLNLTA